MKNQTTRLALFPVALAAGLFVAPMLAQAQRDGTPGNPPGTAVGRALDRATGTVTTPDGTPGNPPGTALGRAVDSATGTVTTPDGTRGNPPGTVVDRAATSAATAVQSAATPTPGIVIAPGSAAAARPRLSQIIGGHVYNEANERIGEVEDILLTAPMSLTAMQGHGPVAILQVGGFLGMGGRLVAVPLSDLRWNTERERMVMPGATKESLQTRAAFDFDSLRRR